jgi:hypothetical protein
MLQNSSKLRYDLHIEFQPRKPMKNFTSEYIKDVSKILSQRSNRYSKSKGIEIAFICHAAEDSNLLPAHWLPEDIQDGLFKYGLKDFSGSGFRKYPESKELAMLRRFMFLDFIELYLEDEENSIKQKKGK